LIQAVDQPSLADEKNDSVPRQEYEMTRTMAGKGVVAVNFLQLYWSVGGASYGVALPISKKNIEVTV